jgi:hypothetical protein
MSTSRNLTLGRGRVQRAALRTLRLFGTVTTVQVMQWAFPRKVYGGDSASCRSYWPRSTRRKAAALEAERWLMLPWCFPR